MPDRRLKRGKSACAAGAVVVLAAAAFFSLAGAAPLAGSVRPLLRVDLRLTSSARMQPRPLVITLGGPVYCGQVTAIVNYLHASLVCPDYGRDGERSGASRARRVEDWGNPAYLDAVARIPDQLERKGLKVSELILVGASYAGYAAAELVATHPGLHPRALVIVDSFLDLRARFRALAPGQPTRTEMIHVLGGTPAQRPRAYATRSPSAHLAGLAAAVEHGTRFVDVWSVGVAAAHEFRNAMCSRLANALWLRRLAHLVHRPVTGYVTRLRHARALWDWWRQLLALAGLATTSHRLPAATFTFQQGKTLSPGSYCGAAPRTLLRTQH